MGSKSNDSFCPISTYTAYIRYITYKQMVLLKSLSLSGYFLQYPV